ncbi:MAG: HAD-IC family P-type ATPase [Clostridia bacterium]|nr:HAD-IC family P-type ATPase [Clostridia bacterium]
MLLFKKRSGEEQPVNTELKIPTVPSEGTVRTPPEGLSSAEAERRKQAGQSNRQADDEHKTVMWIISDNLFTLFNLLNFVLAACLMLVGSWKNIMFLGVVFSNTLIGTVQELRARATMKKLKLLNVRTSRVVRDGVEKQCPADELVLGDLVVFSTGDQIPADSLIVEGACAADESLLTGESEPQTHKIGELLLSGSFLTEGKVKAQLIAVGDNSYAARLTHEAKRLAAPKSELLNELKKLVSIVSKLLVPIGIIMFIEQYFLLKSPLNVAVPKSVAAMIGMLPEGLILLTSVALMAGVVKLGKRKTLVHELFGIETLARVDMLCTDKTGTLTTGETTFERFVPIEADEDELRLKTGKFISAFETASGTLRGIASAVGTDEERAIATVPFSSARKKSAASFANGKTLILGAPSFVTERAVKEADAATEAGFRVLMLAEADGTVENDLIPPVTRILGLVLLRETLRPTAKDTLKWFKGEGVKVRIMSGDDPRTVAALARTLELEESDRVVDCAALSDEELCAAAKDRVIFGRLTPDRKRILVEALKKEGHNVAMTGDGVNDIPSMKSADCSIAMGGGAEATEHAAQLVLLNNDFSSLPAVVAEGRRVIGNITRTASLFLQKTLYSFALSVFNILIVLFLPLKYPFEPIHLTLISSLTVGIPAFFLALEPSSERFKGSFLKRIILSAIPGALGVTCCALAAMISNYLGTPEGVASTLAVLSAGAIGLGNLILICRPFSKLRIAVCALMCLGFAAAAAFFPTVFSLEIHSFTSANWLALALMTAGGLAVLVIARLIVRPFLHKLDLPNTKRSK